MAEQTKKYSEWYYDFIEEPVRDLVFLLRNSGFNTFCSCGHDMTVDMECYCSRAIDSLIELLLENGYEKFNIDYHLETHPNFQRGMRLWIGDTPT